MRSRLYRVQGEWRGSCWVSLLTLSSCRLGRIQQQTRLQAGFFHGQLADLFQLPARLHSSKNPPSGGFFHGQLADPLQAAG